MPTIEEQHLMLPIADKKYWYINIEENTTTKRYYLYAEIIIPIFNNDPGTTYDNNNIYIRFMNTDFATIDSREYSNLDNYSHSKLKIEFDSPLGTSQYSKFSYNTYDFLDSKSYSNNFDDSFPNSNINENFRVISLMILPELNKPDVTIKDNSNTDYSTLLLFINGRQFTFSPNTAPLPLYKFYNGDDAIAQIVVETDFSDTGYDQIPFIIWNTAYDKFVYQDLANMCYKEYTKSIMNVNNNIKYPLFDSDFKVLVPEYDAFGLYLYSIGNTKSKITIPSSNGFVFYKVFKLTKTSTALNVPIRIDLINLQDDSYNVFNEDYSEEYSFLNITDSLQEQIVRTANYNFNSSEKEKYLICYLRVTNNNQVMFGYGNTNVIDMNFGPTQETVSLINNNYYSLQVKSTNVSYDDDVQIEDISYSGNIPYPTDITTEEKNSLFMSPNNYHWKSLWKYNRTIEYSSPLQDNPVILPLNVFTEDENENMFIEFDISSTYEWRINLFDTGQFTGTTDNAAVTENTLFLNNGIEYHKRSTHLYLNIVKDNESVFDSETYPFIQNGISRFMIYYNSTDKKLLLKFGNSDPKEITEITKDVLRNILCHIPGTGSITINFGPTSDYFQDYIDELLDQDNTAVTLNNLGIGDNYVTDGSYKLLIDHSSGSGSKQYSVKFRIKINNAPDDVSTSDISLLSWEVLPSNTIDGLTFINSAKILPTLSSWDPDTGYMSGYVSLTVNNYSSTGSYTFNLTISYKNDPNNTATGSFGFNFAQKIAYAAIPSGKILQLNGAEAITDEVLDSTLFTIVEHSYDSNNSVIYVANDDQYILEHCPVNIITLTTLNKPKAKATITFTLQDRDTGYMDTIIEKYVEGFYTYNMTIDLEEAGSSRIINGSTKAFLDSFTVNKLSSSKFEVIMTCTKTAVDDNTFKKGTGYLFSSYSTVSLSSTGFGSDIYLALMRAKVDTKLEFTIIGDYYA